MLKTIAALQGVTVLSKEAQKKIVGGQACTYTWQDSNGNWHTEHGHCAHAIVVVSGYGGVLHGDVAYCHTPNHIAPTHLTSNGGRSRCA
jgi:hypothetical protein